MTFEVLSPAEIRAKYARADDKRKMITILSQLTCSTAKEMADFLGVDLSKKPRRSVINEARAREMHARGMNDHEIAAALGVSRLAVYDWRHARGLSANLDRYDQQARMAVYNAGLSDREAAEALRIGRSTFRNWRYKYGLEPNRGEKRA